MTSLSIARAQERVEILDAAIVNAYIRRNASTCVSKWLWRRHLQLVVRAVVLQSLFWSMVATPCDY